MTNQRLILPVIVLAQFLCTSLWFAGNAVMGNLIQDLHLTEYAVGHITSSVQFGFIAGTLIYAFFTISDRFSPSLVFFSSAIVGAVFNLGIILNGLDLTLILLFRFLTGFFLAGIYPVGMKIAADYFQKGLGKSLGFLVGALVLGTAFPHFLKGFMTNVSWKSVMIITSILAVVGGLMILLLVKNGPYRKPSQKLDFTVLFKVFRNKNFRSAAFGYFGHMWELFAFWAFIPFILRVHNQQFPENTLNVALISFIIIASGGVACVLGGYLSETKGVKKTANLALISSGICCLASPFILNFESNTYFLIFLVFWGMMVIADSPLFSTLVAQNADDNSKGTALTIVNCIGFSITIASIQLLNYLQNQLPSNYLFMVLALGPLFGWLSSLEKN